LRLQIRLSPDHSRGHLLQTVGATRVADHNCNVVGATMLN
jgi:hypothetical protein